MEYGNVMNGIIALFSCFVANEVLKDLLGRRVGNKCRLVLSLTAYFLIVLDAVISKYSHWIFPFAVFIGMLILMVNYKVSVKKDFWRIFKVHIVTVAFYVIVLMIINPFGAQNEVLIIFTAIHYIILKAYRRIIESSYKESSVLYIVVPAIFVGLILYIIYGVELSNYQRMLVLFSTVVVVILMITFYNDFVRQYEGMAEKRVLEEQSRAYRQQMQIITQNEQAIRRVEHDMKNHVIMIKHMVEKGSYSRLESYIDKMEERSFINGASQDTGNFEFDAMLGSKIKDIESRGVCVKQMIRIPEELPVDGFDVSVIVGNLLDNAMRAVQDLDKESRWIDFRAFYNRNVFNIVVSNPYKGNIKFDNNHMPETTKSFQKMHGIGLKSVKSSVEKYKGSLDITADCNVFKADVVLYCSGD